MNVELLTAEELHRMRRIYEGSYVQRLLDAYEALHAMYCAALDANRSLVERCVRQSELLSRQAEKQPLAASLGPQLESHP